MTVTEQLAAEETTEVQQLHYTILREWDGSRTAVNKVTYTTHMAEVTCDPACGGTKEIDKIRWNGIKYIFCPECKSRWYYGEERILLPSMRLVELRAAQGLTTEGRAWDAPKESEAAPVAAVSDLPPQPTPPEDTPATPEYYLMQDSLRREGSGLTYVDIKCASCKTIVKDVLSASWSPRRNRAFACPGCGTMLHYMSIEAMEVRPRGTYRAEMDSPLPKRQMKPEKPTEETLDMSAALRQQTTEEQDREALEQAFATDQPTDVLLGQPASGAAILPLEIQIEDLGNLDLRLIEVEEDAQFETLPDLDADAAVDAPPPFEVEPYQPASPPSRQPVLEKIARGDYAVQVAPELIPETVYALLDSESQALIDQVRTRLGSQDRERWEMFWMDALATYHFTAEDEGRLRMFANKYAAQLPVRNGTTEERMELICEVLSDLQRLLQV